MVTGTVGGMPARRVATLVMALAVVALGACNGGGGDDSKSSPAPAPARSTTSGPVIPVGRSEVAGALWDGKIAVAGGFPSPDQAVDRLDLFDVASGTWSVGPPLPHQYDHSSLAELGGRLYVVGGYTGGLSNPTNEVWSLGPGEQAWTDEPDLATRSRRARHRCGQRQARRRRRRRRERQCPVEHRDLHARGRMVAGAEPRASRGSTWPRRGRATRSTPSQAATRTARRDQSSRSSSAAISGTTRVPCTTHVVASGPARRRPAASARVGEKCPAGPTRFRRSSATTANDGDGWRT